jgi:hypothetical protein
VSTWSPKGQARKGDALSRSQGLIAALETGKCRIAGQLDGLEADMLSWEAGQHQPDSVANGQTPPYSDRQDERRSRPGRLPRSHC